MGEEQRAVCSGRLVVEITVLLKLGSSPSGVGEAHDGRICETTGGEIGAHGKALDALALLG